MVVSRLHLLAPGTVDLSLRSLARTRTLPLITRCCKTDILRSKTGLETQSHSDPTRLTVKCILPERTTLRGEILRAWHRVLNPSIHPIHISLQIEQHHHTEEINIDLHLQSCAILLSTALNIAA